MLFKSYAFVTMPLRKFRASAIALDLFSRISVLQSAEMYDDFRNFCG